MSTFLRQCCVCKAVWDAGSNSWIPHDKIIPVASHTYCNVCHQTVMEEIKNEKQLSGN